MRQLRGERERKAKELRERNDARKEAIDTAGDKSLAHGQAGQGWFQDRMRTTIEPFFWHNPPSESVLFYRCKHAMIITSDSLHVLTTGVRLTARQCFALCVKGPNNGADQGSKRLVMMRLLRPRERERESKIRCNERRKDDRKLDCYRKDAHLNIYVQLHALNTLSMDSIRV